MKILLRRTILECDARNMISLEEVINIVPSISFRKYGETFNIK